MDPPRSRQQRREDTLRKLETENDLWVATATADAEPYLVPLSFAWNGQRVIVCAPRSSRTIDNLLRSGTARVSLGTTRDVVMLDVVLDDAWSAAQAPLELADAYARQSGWDPRQQPGDYHYVALRPTRVQAWREANELAGRTLMRDGEWA